MLCSQLGEVLPVSLLSSFDKLSSDDDFFFVIAATAAAALLKVIGLENDPNYQLWRFVIVRQTDTYTQCAANVKASVRDLNDELQVKSLSLK